MPTDIVITVRDLKRASRDLSQDELRLMNRLVVLTMGGQKECVYSNQQSEQELGFHRSTTSRLFKTLKDKGLLTLCRDNTAFGKNTRVVSLNVFNIFALIQGGADTPVSAETAQVAPVAPVAPVATPAPSLAPAPAPTSSLVAANTASPTAARARRAAAAKPALSPALTEVYKFDFTERLDALGLLPVMVGDHEINPVFDFTELAEILSPQTERNMHFAYGWQEICVQWASYFFLFSVINEICFYQDEMFKTSQNCPKYNLHEIEDFIKVQQQGLLFFLLATRDGYSHEQFANPAGHNLPDIDVEYTSQFLVQRIVSRYNPAKSKADSPLPYLYKVIVSQCMDVLANERNFYWALAKFMEVVRSNAQAQRWAERNSLIDGDKLQYEQQLAKYYPTYWGQYDSCWFDLTRKSADGGETQFPMRLSYPFMLFRKLGGLDSIAAYNKGNTAFGDAITRFVNHDLGQCPAVKASFDDFVKRHSVNYPFLLQLAELGFENV